MARAARAALADARALEEQNMRQQMHGGAFYGAGMRVGGGATPSMGLSQFRGGNHCSSQVGSGITSTFASAAARAAAAAATAARAALGIGATEARVAAQVAADARAAAAARAAASRVGQLALADAPVTTLALRPTGALAVRPGAIGQPYDIALDLRGVKGVAPPTGTIASRLAAMGVTPARLAAALAAGVAFGGLEGYFQSQGTNQNYGNYDTFEIDTTGHYPGGPGGPVDHGDPRNPPTGPRTGPSVAPPQPGDLVPGAPKRVVAAYLRSGNAPSKYLIGNQAYKLALAQREGAISGGRMPPRLHKRHGGEKKPLKEGDGRRVRAQKVKEIMAQHGLSLPAASKYLKEHGSA